MPVAPQTTRVAGGRPLAPLEVLLYDWWPLVDERRQINRILDVSVSIRYDAEAAGSGDATTPRNMMNSPTFSGVSSPTT